MIFSPSRVIPFFLLLSYPICLKSCLFCTYFTLLFLIFSFSFSFSFFFPFLPFCLAFSLFFSSPWHIFKWHRLIFPTLVNVWTNLNTFPNCCYNMAKAIVVCKHILIWHIIHVIFKGVEHKILKVVFNGWDRFKSRQIKIFIGPLILNDNICIVGSSC